MRRHKNGPILKKGNIIPHLKKNVCSPYAVAPALFFAVRSQSPSRTRFVHLVYLTCSNRLRSRCLSWRSAFPSTSDDPFCSLQLLSCRQSAFPSLHRSSSKLLRSAAQHNASHVYVHVDTHAQNSALQNLDSNNTSLYHFCCPCSRVHYCPSPLFLSN